MKSFIISLFSSVFILFGSNCFAQLSQENVHEGDYFSVGKVIEINHAIQGDAYVFGGKIFIDGRIEGDLIAVGGTIEVVGEVTGNVRVSGGDVKIYGKVGRNMTIMAGNLQVASFAEIQGNAHLMASSIDLNGKFLKNVTLMGSETRIGADIKGNLKAYVGHLRLTAKAIVQGKVSYSESSEVEIDQGANISGEIEKETSTFFRPDWKKTFVFSSRIIGLLMNFLFSFVLGVIIIKFFPTRLHRSLMVLQETPWKAFGVGLLVLFIIPLCVILLFITVLGIPFAIALVTLAVLSFYAAKILPIIWVSNNIFSRFRFQKNSLLVFFIGLIIFFLFKQIPILGQMISIVFMLLGLGTAVLSRIPHHVKKKTR